MSSQLEENLARPHHLLLLQHESSHQSSTPRGERERTDLCNSLSSLLLREHMIYSGTFYRIPHAPNGCEPGGGESPTLKPGQDKDGATFPKLAFEIAYAIFSMTGQHSQCIGECNASDKASGHSHGPTLH